MEKHLGSATLVTAWNISFRFLPVKKTSDLLLVMSNLYSLEYGALVMSPKVCVSPILFILLAVLWIRIRNNLSCWIRIRILNADLNPDPGGQK
jgi:hypothetical protein